MVQEMDGVGMVMALRLVEGFLIIVQGPLTTNLQLQVLKMFQMIKEAEYISILEGAR